jgi:hypothetical protein
LFYTHALLLYRKSLGITKVVTCTIVTQFPKCVFLISKYILGKKEKNTLKNTSTNKPTLIDIILYLYSAFFKNLKCFTDNISN